MIAKPNPDSLQFRLLGARWAHVDAPRHLSLIPPHALRSQAQRLGLRLAHVTTSDPAGNEWNRFGWEQGLRGCPGARPQSFTNVAVLAAPRIPRRSTGASSLVINSEVLTLPGYDRRRADPAITTMASSP